MNRIFLQVRALEIKPMRFTPAGIPVQELVLEHCSEVIEAGHTRRVEFIIAACAIGPLAGQLQHLQIGDELDVEGFLTPARKNSSKLVLHIQAATPR
ncbi:primosomal replication protein N [Pelistega europaea]|uniref:Replication restart protein PriB n=1 Tax=Pelistega europaea TaxID=106147 RepID=A0A7Y4P6I6_9BURK|nr:primosomal replication protein N [Pelistega europaea]NOL49785.1 primosomal replication protein N [Pelistega europaea]